MYGYRGKRVLDLIGSLILLVLLSPVFLVVAFFVLIFDGRPVIYRRQLLGKEEKPFSMFKFRTMVRGAERLEKEVFQQNGFHKPKKDPRVTTLGNILRRTSLDELPQLVNVLRGEMSLVGPRPLPLWMVEKMPSSRRQIRASCVPGITGLAQVRSRLNPEAGGFERQYAERCSLMLDLHILILTVPAVLKDAC